jgi:hypothetical protein
MIREAEAERDRIYLATEARVAEFKALLEPYQDSPRLFRELLLKRKLSEVYSQPGVSRWVLPAGVKQIVLWLNRDPEALDKVQQEATEKAIRTNRNK